MLFSSLRKYAVWLSTNLPDKRSGPHNCINIFVYYYLSIHLSVCMLAFPFIYRPIYVSWHLFICDLITHPFIKSPIHLPVNQTIYPSFNQSSTFSIPPFSQNPPQTSNKPPAHPSFCLRIFLSFYLSFYVYVCMLLIGRPSVSFKLLYVKLQMKAVLDCDVPSKKDTQLCLIFHV